jgi:hypothetical protein
VIRGVFAGEAFDLAVEAGAGCVEAGAALAFGRFGSAGLEGVGAVGRQLGFADFGYGFEFSERVSHRVRGARSLLTPS